MVLINENDIKKHIKSGNFSRCYFICGDDPFLSANYANLIAQKITDTSGASFNYYPIDNETATFNVIYEACEALPLMSDKICVFLKNMNIQKLKKEELEPIIEYLPKIPDSTVMIFLFTQPIETKKDSKHMQLYSVINQFGIVIELKKRSESDIAKTLIGAAAKRNAVIDEKTANYFVSVAGKEMANLINEFDKLCAYAGSNPITTEMVDIITTKSLEASVFELTDAINNLQSDRAFAILSMLIKEKANPTIIMATIINAYADIYRRNAALEAQMTISDIATAFSSDYRGSEFRLKKATALAKKISYEKLEIIFDALGETDKKVKSFSADNYVLIQELTGRLLHIVGNKND